MSKYECYYCEKDQEYLIKCGECSKKICEKCLDNKIVHGAEFDKDVFAEGLCIDCMIQNGSTNYIVCEFAGVVYVKKVSTIK